MYRIVDNAANQERRLNLFEQLFLHVKNISFPFQADIASIRQSIKLQIFTQGISYRSQKTTNEDTENDLFTLKAGKENFNVASKILPKTVREHLVNIYRYCRYIDDIGDLSDGDRLHNLYQAKTEIENSLSGMEGSKIFTDIVHTVKKTNASEENLFNIIEANIQDQQVRKYDTFEQLCNYCKLSANPVGRLVLSVFGAYSEKTVEYSDKVCTALQIIEHIQDIAEDHTAGRIYIPQEDLKRFRVTEDMLVGKAKTSAAKAKLFDKGYGGKTPISISNEVKRLLSFECGRARSLMLEGSPLIALLPTFFAKIAVAGFIGGGLAQLEAVEKHNYDVINNEVKASKARIAMSSIRILLKSYFSKPVTRDKTLQSHASQLEFRPKSSMARWLR